MWETIKLINAHFVIELWIFDVIVAFLQLQMMVYNKFLNDLQAIRSQNVAAYLRTRFTFHTVNIRNISKLVYSDYEINGSTQQTLLSTKNCTNTLWTRSDQNIRRLVIILMSFSASILITYSFQSFQNSKTIEGTRCRFLIHVSLLLLLLLLLPLHVFHYIYYKLLWYQLFK